MKIQLLVGLLLVSTLAHAENRLQRDPRVNVDQLSQTGQIAVHAGKDGDEVFSDASAVLNSIDFAKLKAAARDYNHYKQMGMPYVLDSRIVSGEGTDVVTTWTFMRTTVAFFTEDSKHYLEVHLYDVGAEWQLVHPSNAPYPDESAFSSLEGSWYAEPLNNGHSAYVRYYLSGEVANSLAGAIGGSFVQKQFTDGVKQVIQTLARQAAIRR
jgi:hypothetical protein